MCLLSRSRRCCACCSRLPRALRLASARKPGTAQHVQQRMRPHRRRRRQVRSRERNCPRQPSSSSTTRRSSRGRAAAGGGDGAAVEAPMPLRAMARRQQQQQQQTQNPLASTSSTAPMARPFPGFKRRGHARLPLRPAAAPQCTALGRPTAACTRWWRGHTGPLSLWLRCARWLPSWRCACCATSPPCCAT